MKTKYAFDLPLHFRNRVLGAFLMLNTKCKFDLPCTLSFILSVIYFSKSFGQISWNGGSEQREDFSLLSTLAFHKENPQLNPQRSSSAARVWGNGLSEQK